MSQNITLIHNANRGTNPYELIDPSPIKAKNPVKISVIMAIRQSIIFPENPSWKDKKTELSICKIFAPNRYPQYRDNKSAISGW